MTWLKWLAVGRQIVECAVHLLIGETCSFTFTWKGVSYIVEVKRGGQPSNTGHTGPADSR